MKKEVVIFGIDIFAKKNIYQLECLNKNDYKLVVFSNDLKSKNYIDLPNEHYYLEATFFKRVKQIYNYLLNNKNKIHHVEIYPGGRFAPIYLMLSLFFKLKVIVVERGDLLYWNEYNFFYKKWLFIVYKLSNLVWYREPYMKNILDKIGVKNKIFLHNCIKKQREINIKLKNRDIDFLWVNRFIKERKIEWVIEVAKKYPNNRFVLVGMLQNAKNKDIIFNQERLKKLKLKNIEIYEFQDPMRFYKRAKFFILPSDIVFLNNALLEAMSYGIVPLISDVQNSKDIIDDGIDGFIFEHIKEGFEKVIQRALKLTEEEYILMSQNVKNKVKKNFSFDVWCKKYIKMIKELNNV